MALILLQPCHLPASAAELEAVAAAPGHRRLAAQLAGGHLAGNALDQLRTLPPESGGTIAPWGKAKRPSVSYTYDARLAEFDAFFDVKRVDRPSSWVLTQSLLVAYRSLLEEGHACGTRMSWAQWSALCSTFHALIGFVTGAEVRHGTLPVAEPPLLRWHMDPHLRWRIGHHVFFALTQGLIIALGCFMEARETGEVGLARGSLRLAARLLSASAAAFAFAAEFSVGQYARNVRPSMEPPAVSAGFSGLLSPDHHYLVRQLAGLRPALRDFPAELVPDHQNFLRAFDVAYESHKYVCARFGGDQTGSLRMSQTSSLPAVDVLHGLKVARMKLARA